MKVVEHKNLSNFHVGSFSSCYEKSKVILEILICPQFKNLNFFELDLILQTVLVKSLVSIQNQPGTLKYILQLIKLCTTFVLVEFCAQFKFWANFTKLQTVWIRVATVFGRGGCSAAGAEPPPRTPPRSWPRSCLLLCFVWTSSSASQAPSCG
jgi:hypothetical protein